MDASPESFDDISLAPVNDDNDLASQMEEHDYVAQGPATNARPNITWVIPFKKRVAENDERQFLGMSLSEWQDVVQEYDELMMNKSKMDRRRFNHRALMMLGKCVAAVRSMGQTSHSLEDTTVSQYRDDAKEAFGEFRDILLNAKEMAIDDLTSRVVAFIDKGLSPGLTADERKEELQKKSLSFLADISPQLSIKAAPVVKSFIARQFGSDLDDLLGEIRLPEMSPKAKTHMYKRMFENLMDDPRCVSFACSNDQLLGQLAPEDVWFLTFFAFVTVKRSGGDNLLMLGCVGEYRPSFLNNTFTIFK